MLKKHVKLLLLVLFSALYAGCDQEPYDWSEGKIVIERQSVTSSKYSIQSEYKIKVYDTDRIDSVRMGLSYQRKMSNGRYIWTSLRTLKAGLVEGTKDTYESAFGSLSSGTNYRLTVWVWADGIEEAWTSKYEEIRTSYY